MAAEGRRRWENAQPLDAGLPIRPRRHLLRSAPTLWKGLRYYSPATTMKWHLVSCARTHRASRLKSLRRSCWPHHFCSSCFCGFIDVLCQCGASTPAHRSASSFTIHVKLKVIFGFYMIATKVDSVYKISLPADVKRLSSLCADQLWRRWHLHPAQLGSVASNELLFFMITPIVLVVVVTIASLVVLLCRRLTEPSSRGSAAAARAPLVLKLLSSLPSLPMWPSIPSLLHIRRFAWRRLYRVRLRRAHSN